MFHRHWGRGHGRHHHHSHRFGPWAWEGRFFERGEVRLALLSLLADGPRHGYELMKALEEKSQGLYTPSAGTIYPTLQQLQDEDLIASSEVEGGKRVYEIKPTGTALLAAEAATVAAIWERPKDEEWGGWGYARHPDAGIVMKPAFRLMRTAVRSVMRSKDPNRADKVRDILRQAEEDIRNLNGEH